MAFSLNLPSAVRGVITAGIIPFGLNPVFFSILFLHLFLSEVT
jgi:hypothetical protein